MTKENIPLVDTTLTDNAIDSGEVEENPQLALAALASMNNQGARAQIQSLVEPLIDFQTDCFCKRFCGVNHLKYRCSLANPIVSDSNTSKIKPKRDCEWGNASNHWMCDSLINKQRLLKFSNRHGDNLYDYFFQIINSLSFFQRWKGWRFGATGIPPAIQNMGPSAVIVFKGLQQQRKLRFIAEQAGFKVSYVEALTKEIIRYFSDTNTFYSLQLNDTSNTSGTPKPRSEINPQDESEIAAAMDVKESDARTASDDLNSLWEKLNVTEQFVVEAIVVNQQADKTVLYALKIMDIRIKEGVLPEDTTVEMLHAFKTDSIIKLAHCL